MWICKSCGKENQSDRIDCWSCSTPKDETTVPPQPLESTPAEPIPTQKIYTQNSIWAGGLLGGPVVAGYIIARNFKAFNESNKALVTWIITISATAAIFGVALLFSDRAWRGIPIGYTAGAYFLIRHYQGAKIDAHIKAGGATHGFLNILGVSILGFILTFIPVIVIAVAVVGIDETAQDLETPEVREYQALKHEIHFLRSNISVEEIDKLADGLTKTEFFGEGSPKQVWVRKVNDTYELSIPCTSELTANPDLYKAFIPLRNGMQQLFPRNKIVLNLVVENLDDVVKRIE